MEDNLSKPTELILTVEMRQLIERAEQNDATALPELRTLLNNTPALWQAYGDLAHRAETAWLTLICGPNLCLHESIQRKLAQLRDELGSPSESPLEVLLVQRIVACWLQVHYADIHLAQLREQQAHPTHLRVVERFLDRSHTRYLSAVRSLASVRKLLKPALSPMELLSHQVAETPTSKTHKKRDQFTSDRMLVVN